MLPPSSKTTNLVGKAFLDKTMPSGFPRLPAEIFFTITDNLDKLRDLNSFVRASRPLYDALNPRLYKLGFEDGVRVDPDDSFPHILPGERPADSIITWAIKNERGDALKRLLQAGWERYRSRGNFLCLINYNMRSPLHIAISQDSLAMASIILDHGIDANTPDGSLSPVFRARSGNMVRLLVEYGGDLEGKLSGGRTPLLSACEDVDETKMEWLLGCGADVGARDSWGRTPLHMTIRNWEGNANVDAVELLLAHDADVNALDDGERSVLHCAIENMCCYDVLTVLVENGADLYAHCPSTVTGTRSTPIDLFLEVMCGEEHKKYYNEFSDDIIQLLMPREYLESDLDSGVCVHLDTSVEDDGNYGKEE